MSGSCVAVTLEALLLAESKIVGCVNCSDRVSMRFERLLDTITGHLETTSYVLPAAAHCPFCQAHVFESTMVEPNTDVYIMSNVMSTESNHIDENRLLAIQKNAGTIRFSEEDILHLSECRECDDRFTAYLIKHVERTKNKNRDSS